ncbi:MAG: hypothetical protein ACI8R4_003496, partial [Paracoccaceae bacterium]
VGCAFSAPLQRLERCAESTPYGSQHKPECAAQFCHAVARVPAPMRQNNPLRRPADHPLNSGSQLVPIAAKCHAHIAWHLTVRVGDLGPLGKQSHPPRQVPGLKILKQIRQDQGFRRLVGKHRLAMRPASLNNHLPDLPRPGHLGLGPQIMIKPPHHPALGRPRRNAGCGPCRRPDKRRLPLCD